MARFCIRGLVTTLLVTNTLAQFGQWSNNGDRPTWPPAPDDGTCTGCSACNDKMKCGHCYADSTSPLCTDCHNYCLPCQPCDHSFQLQMACAGGCSGPTGAICKSMCQYAPPPEKCAPCKTCQYDIVSFDSGVNSTCDTRCAKCYGFMDNESCEECQVPCSGCREAGCIACVGWEVCDACVDSDSDSDSSGDDAASAGTHEESNWRAIASVGSRSTSVAGLFAVVGVLAAAALYSMKLRKTAAAADRAASQNLNVSDGKVYGSVPTELVAETASL